MADEKKGRAVRAEIEATPQAVTTAAAEPVEVLAERLDTPAWVVAGMKAANGWGEGKQLTEAEFKRAVTAWLGRPMGGDR